MTSNIRTRHTNAARHIANQLAHTADTLEHHITDCPHAQANNLLVSFELRRLAQIVMGDIGDFGDIHSTTSSADGRRLQKSAFERFMSKIDKNGPGGCWIWQGPKYPNGYAKFTLPNGRTGGRPVLGHRFSFEAHVGPIVNVINHKCEVKLCVNPEHLEDVTQKENLEFSRPKVCVRGHALSGTDSDVRVSRSGKRQCRICVRIRVSAKRQLKVEPRAGDIGKPEEQEEWEIEPLSVPVPEQPKVPA